MLWAIHKLDALVKHCEPNLNLIISITAFKVFCKLLTFAHSISLHYVQESLRATYESMTCDKLKSKELELSETEKKDLRNNEIGKAEKLNRLLQM